MARRPDARTSNVEQASDGSQFVPQAPTKRLEVTAVLGEVVALFMRDARFRHMTLAELETAVGPALLLNQFLIARGTVRTQENATDVLAGSSVPMGLALWAMVSPAVSEKLDKQLADKVGYRLAPNEWNSGDELWLLAVVGPVHLRQTIVDRLNVDAFKGRPYRLHTFATWPPRQPPIVEGPRPAGLQV